MARRGPNPGAVFAGSFLSILSQLLLDRRNREREQQKQATTQKQQQNQQAQQFASSAAGAAAGAGSLPELDSVMAQFQSSPLRQRVQDPSTFKSAAAKRRQQLTEEEARATLQRAQQFLQGLQGSVEGGETIAGSIAGSPSEVINEGLRGLPQEQIDQEKLGLLRRQMRVSGREEAEAFQAATREAREARRLELAEEANARAARGESRAAESFELNQEAQRIANEINRIRLDALGRPDPEDPATPADAARVLGFVFQASDDARNIVSEMFDDREGLRELANEAGVEIPIEGILGMSEGEPRFDKLVEHVRDKILDDSGVTSEVREGATRILSQSLGSVGDETPPDPAGGDDFQTVLAQAQRLLQSQSLEQVISFLRDPELVARIGKENAERIIETIQRQK